MNNTMVREVHGEKINPKSSIKNEGALIRGGANYARKYGILWHYSPAWAMASLFTRFRVTRYATVGRST
jgi:hypothetical protein